MAAGHKPLRRAYKFMNAAYISDFLNKGRLRIGTALEFRQPDGKTGGRSDETELTAAWQPADGRYSLNRDHPFLRSIFGDDEPEWRSETQPLEIVFTNNVKILHQANVLMFCVSWQVTPAMVQRMATDFDADSCVKISSLGDFAQKVSSHPFLRGRPWSATYVRYNPKPVSIFDPEEDQAFRKDICFGWQREFRVVWGGDDIPNTGEVIDVPGITPLLKKVL